MLITKELKRHFTISDLFMREGSQTMLDHGFEDQPQLVLFDPDITVGFLNTLQTKLNASSSVLLDETLRAQLRQKTDAANKTRIQCCDYFQVSKHFIYKKFSDNNAILDEFGYSSYNKCRSSQKKMIDFMDELYYAGNKYRVELKSVGATDAQIDYALTLKNKLYSENREQEIFKDKRKEVSRERIIKHNAVWDDIVKLSEVGKIVFKSNYTKYQQYLLPASEESEKAFSIRGRLIDSITLDSIEDAVLSIESLNLHTTSDSKGEYGFGLIPNGTYSIRVVKNGYLVSTIDNVDVTATKLKILNVILTPQ